MPFLPGLLVSTLGNVVLNNTTITNNSTSSPSGRGGGLFAVGNATLNSSIISNNSNTGNNFSQGGGLYVAGNATLASSTVSNNSTKGSGGGVLVLGNATLTASTVSNNSATGQWEESRLPAHGGGLNAYNVTLIQSSVIDNTLSGKFSKGGGVHSFSGVTVTDSTISNNSVIGDSAKGGALSIYSGRINISTITNSTITNNSITGNSSFGGGLQVFDAVIVDSTISENTIIGNGRGGGLSLGGDGTINQSTISGNSIKGTDARGGGIYIQGSLTLDQSTISSNSTSGINAFGAGIFTSFDQLTINQSTIVFNTAESGAGGISVNSFNNTIISNSILSANTGPEGNFYSFPSTNPSNVTATNSLFGDAIAEIGTPPVTSGNKITNTPGLGPLQDNGGPTLTHLPSTNSRALDAGNNTEAMAFSNDQRNNGFPRIFNDVVDIGAVELQTIGASFSYDIDDDGTIAPLSDGILVLRYLFGFSDDALVAGAVGSNPNRSTAADISAYLQAARDNLDLDIDGNGAVTALTDGLLLLRYQFGFRGNSLIQGAIGDNATRTTAVDIESFLD